MLARHDSMVDMDDVGGEDDDNNDDENACVTAAQGMMNLLQRTSSQVRRGASSEPLPAIPPFPDHNDY